MKMVGRPYFFALCALALIQGCISAVSNRTIDDFSGDVITGFHPMYWPHDGWNVVVVRTIHLA
jgi:hypothetical protein